MGLGFSTGSPLWESCIAAFDFAVNGLNDVFARVVFRKLQKRMLGAPAPEKFAENTQSCVLPRHKLGFSPDKLRFIPDGTTTDGLSW